MKFFREMLTFLVSKFSVYENDAAWRHWSREPITTPRMFMSRFIQTDYHADRFSYHTARINLNTLYRKGDHNHPIITKREVWLLRTWFGLVNKLVSLTWLLWALRSFRRFTSHCITLQDKCGVDFYHFKIRESTLVVATVWKCNFSRWRKNGRKNRYLNILTHRSATKTNKELIST